jgi:hypothetical protein
VPSYDLLAVSGSPREYVINGRALSSLIAVGGRICAAGTPAYTKALLRRGAPILPTGRCPLYVCECCGDLGCGAVTVRVTEVDDCFVWSELSIESWYGGCPATWLDDRLERDFYFARDDYLGAIY